MKTCIATLQSITAYSQSRNYSMEVPPLEKEGKDDYERRTWRNKAHVENGEIYIPPMSFKQALDAAAKRLGIQIPGKGKATYTKHFLSGVLITDKLMTGAMIDDVPGEWVYVNSDGVRGSGSRVWRCFPTIQSWSGDLTFHVLDDVITQDVFERALTEAASFIGVGRFRPEKGGLYGRFQVVGTKWEMN